MMRHKPASDILYVLAVFIYTYPVFSLFVFLSFILMLLTIALSFSGFNYKWEKFCARLLVFSMIPVITWIVYFFRPGFSPLLITLIIWLFFPLVFIFKLVKIKIQNNIQRPKIPGWECKHCKTFNEYIFLVCKDCNAPKQ